MSLKKTMWILAKNNTAPFIIVALGYFLLLGSPFAYFLTLKGRPHTSGSVELKEYAPVKFHSLQDSTKQEDFVEATGEGVAQLNEFDDDEGGGSASMITKNVHKWKEDADSRGFILLTRIGIFSAILAFGALGAAVSLITRVRNNESILSEVTISEILSVQTIGAVFAGILGLAFMGNLLSGAIFPNPSVFYRIIYIPAAFAKLLVWSFLAGFSERLVPNVLNNLVKQVNKDKSGI
jgi:hypothetical protein